MIRRRLYIEERVSRLAVWSLRIAVFALPVTFIGLSLYGIDTLDFHSALYIVLAGVAVAAAALLLALIAFVVIWNEGLRGLGRVIAASIISLMLIAPTATIAAFTAHMPALRDVTTNTEDPPAFVTLNAARSRNANSLAYPGETAAAEQFNAYPEIKPLDFDNTPDEVFSSALSLVTRRKWRVVDVAPPRGGLREGRIEAVARGLPFGLRDDIVIRIRRTPDGSQVDMRSVSRNSDRDFGSNARRIDAFLTELAETQGRRRR
jgi:uncharacterized protein (DUF1499 family)